MVDCGESPDPLKQMKALGLLSLETEHVFRRYGLRSPKNRIPQEPRPYESSPEHLEIALGWYATELARKEPPLEEHLRPVYLGTVYGIYERNSRNGNAPVLEKFRPLFPIPLPSPNGTLP